MEGALEAGFLVAERGDTVLVCVGDHAGEGVIVQLLLTILLDAGSSISAKEGQYGSTPLAWAARTNMPDMGEFLLARGASTNLPDDEPWATPLAWAERRGYAEVTDILRKHGATSHTSA